MSTKKITVAMLGAGRIGQVHLKAMQSMPDVRVKILADPFLNDKLEKQIKLLGVETCTKNANAVFADKEIQAVFICSPTDTHSKFSLEAIKNNKHVFCEKPVDHDLKKINKVMQALRGTNLVYQVGFNRRFDHNFLAVKKSLMQKKVGVPQMIRITSRDPSPPPISYIKSSGGLFMDMMIHDFDMARFQTNAEVAEVYAVGTVLVNEEIKRAGDIDSAIVTLKFSNGMIGLIENCRKAVYGYDQRIEVLGTKGAISITNDSESTAVISGAQGIVSEKPLLFFLERYHQAYINEQVEFFNAINKAKSKKPLANSCGAYSACSVIDGYEAVRIAQAALVSLKQNRPVKLMFF